jgi:hypothetical protein
MSEGKPIEESKDLIVAPKVGGRPKGAKSSYRLTPEMLQTAKMMYIQGKSIPEIGKIMGVSSLNTLYSHMKSDGWDVKRNNFMESSFKGNLDILMKNSMVETERMIDDLKTFRERAMDPVDAGTLAPKKFGEAGNTYMQAVELERKLRAEALHLTFITEVAKIIKQRVKDPDLLAEIGNDLRTLFIRSKDDLEAPE